MIDNSSSKENDTANLKYWYACFFSVRFWQYFFMILFGSIPHF